MELDEARLKSHQVTREEASAAAASGLSGYAEPTRLDVLMDLQASSTPRLVDGDQGEHRFVGTFTAFTHDDRVQIGDRLYDTPHGALRVEAVMAWDDEEPTHYELGLVPA